MGQSINYTELCYGWNSNWKKVNRNKKSRECHSRNFSQPQTPRGRERDKKGTTRAKQTNNAREAHRPAPSSPSEAHWAILLSFHFTYTVQTRPCTNEALIINYTELVWLESELNILFELQKKLIEKYRECHNRNCSQEEEKKDKKQHAQNKQKYIDQLPPPQARSIGLFCYILSFHTLYKRGLVQTRPWKGMVLDLTVNKSLYQSHVFPPQLIFGWWIVVLVFNGPSTLHIISSVVS